MEKKVKELKSVSMEVIEKRFPDTDFIDKAIIMAIINSPKSYSHNTLFNQFQRNIKFFERLDNLIKRYPQYLKRWEQKKPTLQIGSERVYQEYLNEVSNGKNEVSKS